MTLTGKASVITSTEAFALLRALPGDARIVHQVFANTHGLLFQFESGIQISWLDGEFILGVSGRLREEWAALKAEQ